ncbi:Vitamin B12 import ATP-binding protein BtuD [subsurface metagenome]
MDDRVVIRVEDVSKKYCKSLKKSMLYGVKDIGRNILGLSSHSENLRKDEFWALDDVSFEVRKGETLGIIGPNGSGKTTLLKLLNGIFWPDKGDIAIRGKVGALIEIGAGFHPLLTGRENVYLNAAILGMTKEEVEKKFQSIEEFADIGDFIDAPVKFYSSGMFVRLGFAVAVHCDPDILLVDEVLAVGDAQFIEKCSNRINTLLDKGMTLVLVSHNQHLINILCSRAIVLNKGKEIINADVTTAVRTYEGMLLDIEESQGTFSTGSTIDRNKCHLVNHRITDEHGLQRDVYPIGGKIRYSFEYWLHSSIDLSKVQFYLGLLQEKERFIIARYKNTLDGFALTHHEGRMEFVIDTILTSGNYFFEINFLYDEWHHLAIQYSPKFRVLHPTLPKIDKEYFGRFLLKPKVEVYPQDSSK